MSVSERNKSRQQDGKAAHNFGEDNSITKQGTSVCYLSTLENNSSLNMLLITGSVYDYII